MLADVALSGWVCRPFNVADCSDLSLLINHVARNYDHSHLYAIGFSLGGNFVTRYLMESGRNTPLTAALSICNSFNCKSSDEEHRQAVMAEGLRPVTDYHCTCLCACSRARPQGVDFPGAVRIARLGVQVGGQLLTAMTLVGVVPIGQSPGSRPYCIWLCVSVLQQGLRVDLQARAAQVGEPQRARGPRRRQEGAVTKRPSLTMLWPGRWP